uniref:Acid phosphatase n=2 Tax=Kwoniella dejecticola CBS 10117 TaxID=1296121 RepID=A0A1A6AHK8_9TREE|nr:acid phosphatase [Kwoniella dejecticola CBS 10117]OBR89546.1 acid phosphatase [Kwoniella dejecticola CBS 10117]
MFDKSTITLFMALLSCIDGYALTHYPPSNTANTDLDKVINGTGAPGIYWSSNTPDEEYGTYNWCHMPHVRKTEYQVPSQEYELQYVEVIQRHHKRTPYASNTFFKEDIPWDCSAEGPYHHAKNANPDNTAQVVWQRQTGSQNPFEKKVGPGFVGSTCEFPSITSEGIDDALVHGQDVRGVYGDLLGFLPLSNEKEKYSFRVTSNVITSQTLGGFGKGLFPDLEEHTGWIQDDSYDSLKPALACKLRDTIGTQIIDLSSEWGNHLNWTLELRERFNNVSGIEFNDTAGWSTSWDHPYDNMSAKQCHGKPLPCSVNNTAICVPQEDANTIYRLGNYEYAYRWRMAENSTLYSALTMGPWFIELQDHFKGKMDGSNPVKYAHNFAHDGSVAPVLGLLQHDEPVWPGMGSEVVFELYKQSESGEYFVRVLFSGQPLKTSTPLGTLDMVPSGDFEAYLKDTIPENLTELCK